MRNYILFTLLFVFYSARVSAVINVVTDFGVVPDGSDQTAKIQQAFQQALKTAQPVYFPKGNYGVSAQIVAVQEQIGKRHFLGIQGDGPGQTKIIVLKPLTEPLISAKGLYNGIPNQQQQFGWMTIKDISFEGKGNQADAFYLQGVSVARFDRVQIRDFNGFALQGKMFWDSVFTDVHFLHSGSAADAKPAVQLGSLDATDKFQNSNNIQFTNCHWESNSYVDLRLMELTRKVRLMGSKFHGTLPSPTAFDQVQIYESENNTFESTNFTNGGGSAIVLRGSTGNIVTSSIIGNHRGYGILLAGPSKANIFSSNTMVDGGQGNTLPDFFYLPTQTALKAENQGAGAGLPSMGGNLFLGNRLGSSTENEPE